MIQTSSITSNIVSNITDNQVQPLKKDKEENKETALAKDSLSINKNEKSNTGSSEIFKNAKQINPRKNQNVLTSESFTNQEINKTDDTKSNPWGIKSLDVGYGIMRVNYSNSDIHISQPGNNNDLTLHNVTAHDRTSFEYLIGNPRFAPDEPQTNIKIAAKFENNFGVEANFKHNKYVVSDGQYVNFDGTMNGQDINSVKPLNTLMQSYQMTDGLNQVSLMGTYSLNLPSPKKDSFTYNIKAGPSVLIPYTTSNLVNPDGSISDKSGPYHLGGYGAIAENSLKYSFRNSVFLEAGYSLSYLKVPSSLIPGGTASQSILANQFSLTLGKTFNFHKK